MIYFNEESGYHIMYHINTQYHFSAWIIVTSADGDYDIESEDDPLCVTAASEWKIFLDGSWMIDETVSIECARDTETTTDNNI